MHGGPLAECSDDHKDWFPQRHICYPTMLQKAAQRTYEELHRDAPFHDGEFKYWSKDWSPGTPHHYMDGVTIWLSPVELNADDEFLGA